MNPDLPEKIDLANIPTPIQELSRLSEHLGGPEIYIKRDDLTGCELTGNKIRKLEFSLAEARGLNADTLITTGGIDSNHCRATVIAGAKLGLKTVLYLRGAEPEHSQGNVLLDRLAGAEIRWITPEEYKERGAIMAGAADEIDSAGGKAYVIPEGASNDVGAWGYINGAFEIADQCAEEGLQFDAVFNAIGSGGTTAGLVLGFKLKGLNLPVMSVAVCNDADYFNEKVSRIMQACVNRYSLDISDMSGGFEIIEGYIGPGYGVPYREVIDSIKLAASLEGIFVDPVYTGKALWGMIDQIKKGRFEKTSRILFLHTGGIYDLFAYNKSFEF
ncbi:MAG: D-cysteine desulfhydrase family protein [Planctomycetota bacterium]|nr:MAG: D-cysteine desulfhydrase family protein [Planctomycetota bacterium]